MVNARDNVAVNIRIEIETVLFEVVNWEHVESYHTKLFAFSIK